jgi:hypothetical protein
MADIGGGDYGRGGAKSAQAGAGSATYKYKAQDARSYLSGQDLVDYDTNVGYLSKGYSGELFGFGPGGYANKSKADRLSQTNYMGASSKIAALRKKAAEKLRAGGSLVQGEGQAIHGRGRTTIPGKGGGPLLKGLEIDVGWAANKKFANLGDVDYSKPWLFKDPSDY